MEIDKSSSKKELENQKTKNDVIGKSPQIGSGKLKININDIFTYVFFILLDSKLPEDINHV